MSRVIAPFAQFFNGDGTPLENGWLKFLNSNSNNSLKNTYADADQTVANANPLQLDAEGRCPNVFGQGVYRVELYTNNPVTHLPGALIQQFDPVYAEYLIEGAGGNFAEWDTDESYQVGSIVIYNGKYYRSYTSNNQGNMPDTATDEWEQIAFLRYWNADVTYLTDDVVISGSQLYFSLADANTGNVPLTSPAWWDPVGSGTTLLNWSESGTTFQPNATGYDLGSATNIVGDAWINFFGQFTFTPSSLPTLDYHIANKIYVDETAALRMRWMSDWVPGTYLVNDVVRDDNWTMIANTTTEDRPAPQPVGDATWVRDAFAPPAFSETSDTQTVLYIGQRYEFVPAFIVRALRIWLPATSIGDNIEIWAVYNPTTNSRIVNIIPGFVISDTHVEKWIELSIGSQYVEAGSIIDFIMIFRPGTGALTFTYEWDYVRSNGDPGPGEIYHQGGINADQIRLHEQDTSLIDRTADLNNIAAGSTIKMVTSDYTWEVLSVSKTGDIYTFVVDPGARASAATSDFTFTYFAATPIYYVYNTDLFLSDARISGYFGTEYDPTNVAYINDNGYGIDVEVQNVIASDDWEVVAASAGAITGGESPLVYWEEAEEVLRPVTSAVGQLGDATHLISGLYLGDSSNIYVGNGQDLSIVHDGTDSYILNGTGFLSVGTNTATSLYLTTNNTPHWAIDSAGELLPVTDSTYSIGSTSLRVLKLWADDIESTNVPTIAGGSFIDAAVPDQTGNAGEFLTTDGTTVSWSPITVLTEQSNLIIDPTFQIWQRYDGSTPFTTLATFTSDRKQMGFSSITMSVDQIAGTTINGYTDTKFGSAVTISLGTLTSAYAFIQEYIEDVRTLHNTRATVNILADIPIGNSCSIALGQHDGLAIIGWTPASEFLVGTGSPTLYTVYVDIPDLGSTTINDDSFIFFRMWLSAGSNFDSQSGSLGLQPAGTINLYAWQIREGTRDSIIEIPRPRENWDNCYRYYLRLSRTATFPNGPISELIHIGVSTTTTGGMYIFPVPMRTTPTASLDDYTLWSTRAAGSSTNYALTSNITTVSCTSDLSRAIVVASVGTSLSGQAVYIFGSAIGRYIEFSAEF